VAGDDRFGMYRIASLRPTMPYTCCAVGVAGNGCMHPENVWTCPHFWTLPWNY